MRIEEGSVPDILIIISDVPIGVGLNQDVKIKAELGDVQIIEDRNDVSVIELKNGTQAMEQRNL